jgi:DNA-binding NarL/FixJ family response regulator
MNTRYKARRSDPVLLPNTVTVLTQPEWIVLLDVADDLTNVEIADRLCLTVLAVDTCCDQIGSKLGLKSPRSLPQFARQYQAELIQWHERLTSDLPPPLI